jgi:hypothetical protein
MPVAGRNRREYRSAKFGSWAHSQRHRSPNLKPRNANATTPPASLHGELDKRIAVAGG